MVTSDRPDRSSATEALSTGPLRSLAEISSCNQGGGGHTIPAPARSPDQVARLTFQFPSTTTARPSRIPMTGCLDQTTASAGPRNLIFSGGVPAPS